MKLTDGTKTISIQMLMLTDAGFTPDYAPDFFEAGNLGYDDDQSAYIVGDVGAFASEAKDWAGRGVKK